MTTVASLLYASSDWWGFTNAAERSRLDRLLSSLRRGGYLPEDFPSFVELSCSSDAGLFKSTSSNPEHVLLQTRSHQDTIYTLGLMALPSQSKIPETLCLILFMEYS